MIFFNSIGRRVARVIKQRVRDAQKEHDAECRVIEKEAETRKEAHATSMVEKIIGR